MKNKGKPAPQALWLPPGLPLPPPERPRINLLRHEAGHMVVAKVLGFETLEMEFKPTHAGAKISPAPNITDIPSLTSYLERRIPVLYAGAMAEAKTGEEVLEMLKDERAKDDFSKIRELLQLYTSLNRGELSAEAVHQKNSDRLWHRADTLVDKYKPQIVNLSKLFFEKFGGREDFTIPTEEIAAFKDFADLPFGGEIDAMAALEAPDDLKSEVAQDGGTQ
jgi:hypothetical protein